MEEFPTLKNPPIVEAVFEVQMALPEGDQLETLKNLFETYKEKYPKEEEIRLKIEFRPQSEDSGSPVVKQETRGFRFISAGMLLRLARTQLAVRYPDAFITILLGLIGGLRRNEIDALLWDNVDLESGRIIVDSSEHGRLKTPESHGSVDIDEHMVEVLRGFRARAAGKFVIAGERESRTDARRTWSRYRCESTFDFVNLWLRRQGVDSEKPLHSLRKESGCLVAQQYGLFPAQQHLRHRDISTTAHFYLDRKTKAAIDTAALLKADEGGPSNIVSMPSADMAEAGKRSKRVRRRIS